MTSTERFSTRGMLFVVMAVTFWGCSASLAKYLFLTRYDPLIITQTRSSLSFLLLAAWFLATDRAVFRVRWQDLFKFALIGVVGIATTNYTYYFTVKEASVATAILVQNAAPAVVMIYAVVVTKEEALNGIKLLALVFALAGCFLAVSGGSLQDVRLPGWAIVTAPVSMLTYAFMLIASKQLLRKYSVWTLLVTALGFATLFWLFVNPPWVIIAKQYGGEDWAIFLGFAVVSILLPYIFFAQGLRLLEATTAGIISTLEPVVAIISAWVALGETIGFVQILGGGAVVSSIILLQLRREHLRRFMRSGKDAR